MTVLKTSLRNFYSHKGRMILSGLAVVLSVAFVCGTLVFTDTMNATFDKLFASTASNVVVQPAEEEGQSVIDDYDATGVPDTVPAALADQISAVDGVEQVTGSVSSSSAVVVDENNENVGPTTGAPTLVINWSEIEAHTAELTEGEPPSGPDEIIVDSRTADKKHLAVGDPLRLITVAGDHELRISGIFEFTITNPGAAVFYTDLPTAQQYLLNGADAYTTLYVDSDGQISDEQLKSAIAEAVGADTYKLQTADEFIEENRDEVGQVLDILQYVLLGFAGIALLVGIFLIVNTFSMLVAQRTREIGLMRAIGASRRQVNRSVLFEAALLGVIGSVIGVGAGVGLAVGLMAIMSAIGVELNTDDLTVAASVPVVGIVLGVLVTLLAAYIPARRAARISPMAALRDVGTPGDARAGRVRATIGAVLTLAGLALLAVTGTVDKASDGAGYLALGVPLSLVGLILVGPALVGIVVRGLSVVLLRMFGSVGRLAERNALRNPRRTGATASALMIGLALVSGLSVVGSSMVASATEQVDESLGADYIVTPAGSWLILPEVLDAAHAVPELDHVTEMRYVEVDVTWPDGEQDEHGVNVVDPSFAADFDSEVIAGDVRQALENGELVIREEDAEEYGLAVGDRLPLALDEGGSTELTVGAVLAKGGAVDAGTWYLDTETLRAHVAEDAFPLPMMLFAAAKDGQEETARAALEAAMEPYPQMEVRDQAEFKEMIRGQIGGLLNLVYGLLALAIIVAILGVVNTLALAVVERTREIGLMRAIGLSRRQLRRMIRLESVVIALFGALLGLGLGMAWGTAAQKLMALEGLDVLEIPWSTIVTVFVGSALVGLLAALLPAFRAGRMNVLNAIATE